MILKRCLTKSYKCKFFFLFGNVIKKINHDRNLFYTVQNVIRNAIVYFIRFLILSAEHFQQVYKNLQSICKLYYTNIISKNKTQNSTQNKSKVSEYKCTVYKYSYLKNKFQKETHVQEQCIKMSRLTHEEKWFPKPISILSSVYVNGELN